MSGGLKRKECLVQQPVISVIISTESSCFCEDCLSNPGDTVDLSDCSNECSPTRCCLSVTSRGSHQHVVTCQTSLSRRDSTVVNTTPSVLCVLRASHVDIPRLQSQGANYYEHTPTHLISGFADYSICHIHIDVVTVTPIRTGWLQIVRRITLLTVIYKLIYMLHFHKQTKETQTRGNNKQTNKQTMATQAYRQVSANLDITRNFIHEALDE